MTNQVNLEHANCIIRKEELGTTIVHNICNSTLTEVPWGVIDWLGIIGIVSVILLILSVPIYLYFDSRY